MTNDEVKTEARMRTILLRILSLIRHSSFVLRHFQGHDKTPNAPHSCVAVGSSHSTSARIAAPRSAGANGPQLSGAQKPAARNRSTNKIFLGRVRSQWRWNALSPTRWQIDAALPPNFQTEASEQR